MKRGISIKAVVLSMLLINVVLAGTANAWIGEGSGGGGTGGGGGGGSKCTTADYKYREDCAGVSWIFYKSTKDASQAKEIVFPTFLPYARGIKNAVIDKSCAEHTSDNGGFWHFGINATAGSDWYFIDYSNGTTMNYNGKIYTAKGTSSGTAGHWYTINWGFYRTVLSTWSGGTGLLKPNTGANQEIEHLYRADPSRDSSYENVLKEFQKTWENERTEPVPDYIPDGVYAFCTDDTKLSGNTYKAKSNVSVMDEGGLIKVAMTDITTDDEGKEVEIEVEVDKPVQIAFSHNPYSTKGEGTPQWDLYRSYHREVGDSDDMEYTPFDNTRPEWFEIETSTTIKGTVDANGKSESKKNSTVTSWDALSENYIGRDSASSYTDTSDTYVSRDGVNVTFKQKGTWKFCEAFRVSDDLSDSSKQMAKTKVCAKIKVVDKPSSEYYSISNSKNDKALGYKTTGITNKEVEVVSKASKVKVGEEVLMTFSHNIYSERETGSDLVSWEVTPNWGGGSSKYTLDPVTTVTKSGSNAMNLKEGSYYTVDNSVRHNDGSGNYYIVREEYKVTFNEKGSEKFCETVNIESKKYTTSCVEITAEEDIEIPELCAQWTPESYNKSGDLQGNYVEGTTSLVSKIRNESLTGRDSGGMYSNWLGTMVPNGSVISAGEAVTYAKPGDKINWANCYYPGAHAIYDNDVIDGNDDTEPQENNTLDEDTFGNQFDWHNDYKVTSSSDSSNGVFKVGSSVIGMPNKVEPPDNAVWGTNGDGSNPFILDVTLQNADTQVRQSDNDYTVQYRDDAGKYYLEKMSSTGTPYYTKIEYSYHSWDGYACPTKSEPDKRCKYYHKNSFIEGTNYAKWSKETGTLESPSKVIVPYNFINTASFDIDLDDDGEVYAGDTIKVKDAEVTVNERTNGVTADTYITQVDEAEVRLIAYISDKPADEQTGEQNPTDTNAASTNICESGWLNNKQCMEVNKYMYDGVNTISSPATTTLYNRETNTDSVTYGDTTGSYKTLGFSKQYNVFDASAGDYMCFVMAVFPWRSGPEGNTAADITTDPAGTESKWLITAPKCRIIAKKPQLQVLGSSIYMGSVNSTITASVSKKHNLYNISEYMPGAMSLPGGLMSGNPATYFGSFGEQSIVANGAVTRFASGAANGRTTANGSGYGARNDKLCESWSPLTFANYTTGTWGTMMCEDFEVAGYANITDASIVDREALVDYFVPASAAAEAAGSYSLGGDIGTEIRSGTDKNIRYVKASGDATITASTLSRGQTRVLKIDGKVAIAGNIEYNGTFTSMADVPKAVIYASGNIEIGCNVKRVDAILIAGGTVYTCNNYTVAGTGSDMEDADRSREQLVINGLIISGDVELARTYGNAVGIESGTAAEVVNYDTSVLLWGRSAAGANDSNAMSTVYMHELAPRY